MFFGNRNNKNLLTLRPHLIFYGNAPLFNTSCIRFTNPFNYYSAVTVSVSFVHYHSLYPVFLPRNGGIERVYVDFVYEAFRETPCEISGVIAVAIEVTSQVMARKKIEEAEERARMAIESADLGTYEINLLTDEMKTSDRFNEIWGVTHNISRAEFAAHIHPDDKLIRDKAHKESELSGKIYYEARVIWKDQSIHWVKVKVKGKVLYDTNKKPATLLGMIQDITEQKELEYRKDDFISMVSHELKTPLTSLKGYSYLLTEKFTLLQDQESITMLAKMNNQVNRLSYIIQDLLDVTRIEGDKIRFREGNFDFDELVIQMVEEVQSTTQAHQILIKNLEHAVVFADKERTSQVLTNLLTNAIRYSPKSTSVLVAACL